MCATEAAPKAKDYHALDSAEATIPFAWYYDPAHYERELEAIWYRQWIYVCRSNALDAPGAYRTLTIGRQPVFVVRNDNGDVSGYFNSCRHRGSLLLTETEGRLRSRTIACPYHRWCYAPGDGRLLGVSSFAEPDGFDKGDYGLHKIAVAEWRGCVFVNLDVAARFGPNAFNHGYDELKNFPLEDLVLGEVWEKPIHCNWKGFWDNYNECLHCPSVHPELIEMVPIFKRGLLDAHDRPDWRERADDPDPKYRGGLREGAETFSRDGSAQGYARTEGLSDDDLARGVTYAGVLPSIYIGMHVDHARIVRILPLGPEDVLMRIEWLFQQEALDDPAYDIANVTEFAKTVLTEDAMACELNQQGMHAMPLDAGVLMPEEYELKAFKDWLLEVMRE